MSPNYGDFWSIDMRGPINFESHATSAPCTEAMLSPASCRRYPNPICIITHQNKTTRENPAPLRRVKPGPFDQPLVMSGGA